MFNLIAKRSTRLEWEVCLYVRTRYSMIDVEPLQGMFNQRCFDNVVQYAKSNSGYGIAEVIYIEGDTPALHYLNTKDGAFYETTLGWRADSVEYYKIRTIHPNDWESIRSEFNRSNHSWLRQVSTWFDRMVLRIDRVV